jgi:hypothetical protein
MLTSLKLEQTHDTPLVDFSLEADTYSIEGISIPENTIAFYDIIKNWMKSFLDNRTKSFQLKIHLHYYNTSSNISLINFLTDIKSHKNGNHCTILWRYEEDDEDMMYKGEELEEITKLNFIFEVV